MPPPNDPAALGPLDPTALNTINASDVEAAPQEPDAHTNLETVMLALRQAEVESFKQDTIERKTYAFRIFLLTCAWVTAIYVLMILDGFGFKNFHLVDSVMLAAIGSTTANIIGVFLIVARYFFPKK